MFADNQQARCTGCGNQFPLTEEFFTRDKSKKTGFHSRCRQCNKQSCKSRRDKDLEKSRATDKAHYVGERRERQQANAKEYYENNRPAVIKRASARQRENHRLGIPKLVSDEAKINASIIPYQKDHPAEGRYTAEDVLMLRAKQKGLCAYCHRMMKPYDPYSSLRETPDHIIPISRGGTHHPENIALCCRHCNVAKHTRLVSEFLALPDRPNTDTPEFFFGGKR